MSATLNLPGLMLQEAVLGNTIRENPVNAIDGKPSSPMKLSQHLIELSLNLQCCVAQLEQDNQQLQAKLAQLQQEHERLQQSETRYRQLFENAPISMLFINTEGYITQMNQASEHLFGATIEQLNQQACPIFTNPQLVENGTLPYMLRALAGETVIEEPTYYDTSKDIDGGKLNYGKGHYFPIRDKAEVVREIVEIAPDFADLWASQQRSQQERDWAEPTLRKRAATERIKLLNTIAQVANLLLRSPDYTSVLPDVVQLLGEAVGSDRCGITQDIIHSILDNPAVRILTEWDRAGISSSIDRTPEYQSGVVLEGDVLKFHEQFLRGEIANFLIADVPESLQSLFKAQDIVSMLIVPIMVQGESWGQIGFDNCGAPRLFDEAEIAILKIAADSIAAAIERQEKDDELRRSEALYRSLFEISNEGIYRWQLDQPVSVELPVNEQVELVYRYHSFAQANNALATMYGLAKAEDIVGMRLAQVHPQDSAITLEMMRAICSNGWQIRNAESEEIDANGQRHYCLNSIISFVENGFVTSGWGTQIDITQLREAQQALLAAEQARAELLKTMTTIANHLLRSTDYRLILPDVLQLLGEAAKADRCSLAQNITDLASGKPAVQMDAEWCRPGIQSSIAHTPELESALLWENFAELYERLIQGETVQFFGTNLCTSLRELFEAQGNTAMLMVPIVVQGEFWGVFGFDYCGEVQRFEELDQSIFAIAVDSIAAAIERQQNNQALLKAEQNRTAELVKANGALKRSLDALVLNPDPNGFLGHVLKVIAQELDAPVVEHWVDTAGNIAYLNLSCCRGQLLTPEQQASDPRVQGVKIPSALMKHDSILHKQQPVIVEDLVSPLQVSVFEPIGFDLAAWSVKYGVHKYMQLPLVLGERSIGTLCIYIPGDRTFTEQQIELSRAFAHQVTLAIQLTRLAEEAKQAAIAKEQEKAAQEQAAELVKANEFLRRSLNQLANDRHLDSFLGHILSEAMQMLNGASAQLFLYDAASDTLAPSIGVSEQGDILPAPGLAAGLPISKPFPANITGAWQRMLAQRGPVLFDLERDLTDFLPGTVEFHRSRGHRGTVCTALMLDNSSLGFLGLTFHERKDYTTAELEFFQALAQQATLAIQLTRLAEEAKQAAILKEQEQAATERAAQLARANQVLQRTVAQLVGQDNLNHFLTYVLREAARETEAANASIFLYDSQSDTLKMHQAFQDEQVVNLDTDPRFALWKTPIPTDISPAWKQITESFVMWMDINQAQVDAWDFSIPWHLQMGHQSYLCVPLLLGHEPLGFLGLCFRDPIRPGAEPIELVQTLAHQATLALQLTRLAEEAKQSAIIREQQKVAQLQVAELAKANDVLKKTLDTLATEPELNCFLRHILSVIAQQMNAPACLLWLFDDSLQTATLHLSHTDGQVNLPLLHRFNAAPSQPFRLQSSDWVFRTNQRQPYLVEVAAPQFTRASCAYLTRSGVKAILIVPLWLGDQLIGSFGVRLPEVRDFAPSELELVQALGHQATLALQLMQLTEQASHSAVLEERNRMAREIHDVLAQAFTGVVVHLEAAKMIVPQDATLQPLLAQAQDLARAGLVEARRSVWSLRPQALENTNLRSALEKLVQALTHNTSVQVQLQIQGVDCAIAPEVETHLLRIAQEALTNALTHAQACTILIELTFGTQAIELCVRDDGQGFEPTAVRGNSFGLVSMQERADCIKGEFTLTSQPGCGTVVLIAAPLSFKSNAPIRRS